MNAMSNSSFRVNLVQVGIGLIGRTTIEQILEYRDRWRTDFGLDVIYRGLISSDGAVACDEPDGYSEKTLRRVIDARESKRPLAEVAPHFGLTVRDRFEAIDIALSQGPTIVIDTATGERSAAVMAKVLADGAGAVFSNKAPLALASGSFDGNAIWSATGPSGLVRYETTCGAGLPVISTLQTLLNSGDDVIEIIGALSGTLGAIFSDVSNDLPFSAAVKSAMERGYTEPDPRDDLSGLDVARKALILARTMGRHIDLSELAVENLVPPSLQSIPVESFLNRVQELDESMAQSARAASADGKTLKYVATIRPEGPIVVGLRAIDRSTVLGALQGPENIISFRTRRYDIYPLNITGPGAGADVTAAGVVADLLSLATHSSFVGSH